MKKDTSAICDILQTAKTEIEELSAKAIAKIEQLMTKFGCEVKAKKKVDRPKKAK